MVLCRGQQALSEGVTVAEFLHEEQAFFRNHEPWKNTILQQLLGVVRLRSKLERLQTQMIQDSVPAIKAEIKQRLDDARDRFHSLGEALTTDSQRRRYFSSIVDKASNLIDIFRQSSIRHLT